MVFDKTASMDPQATASHPTQANPSTAAPTGTPAPAASTAPAAPAPAADQQSLMQQVAALQRQNEELSKRLTNFQAAKKKEMESLMKGMQEWIQKLGLQNENHKVEFERGLQRLVNNGADDNGVWQVMVSASAAAAQREQEYQALKIQYDELQKQRGTGEFGDSIARVGEKRPADGEPPADASVADIWSSFIADVSTSGYSM